jgi:predicted GNAT superfamily acetyltransferase
MDQIADFGKFQRLMTRLGTTMDKFVNDELVESWWKALRTVPFAEVERRIEDFIARAGENTKWPRPGQFRPAEVPLTADPRDQAREQRANEDNERSWRQFIADHPTTGPIRLRLAQCSRILATTHESSPAYAEAQQEYFALEKQLGEHGRFARDV